MDIKCQNHWYILLDDLDVRWEGENVVLYIYNVKNLSTIDISKYIFNHKEELMVSWNEKGSIQILINTAWISLCAYYSILG